MTDIDFEELDKAVSSLMNKRNQPNPNPNPDAAHDHEPASDSTLEAKPVDEPSSEPGSVDHQTSQASSASSATVIKRPSGRFMDVVHPSSDMRSSVQTRPAPSERPNREAAPLRPIGDGQVGSTPVATSGEAVVSSSSEDSSSELPDLTELSNAFSEDTTTLGASDMGSVNSESEALEPMQSPFLSDVSVDKRPLGGAEELGAEGTNSVNEWTGATASDSPAMGSSGAEQANLSDIDASMPDPMDGWQEPREEINSDEVTDDPSAGKDNSWATEADNSKPEAPVAEPTPPELSAEVLALESDVAQTGTEGDVKAEPETEQKPVAAAAPVAGDIPAQYSASVDDGPEPSAVFEAAAEEPKELQHPVKKKSGWMVIVWILLLLLIGAGGGVAVWYFLLK